MTRRRSAADARRAQDAAAAARQPGAICGGARRPRCDPAPRNCRTRPRPRSKRCYGKVETPTVRGFDLAMVPVAKPRFLGTPPPRVLVKVVGQVADGAAITEAWNAASRARVHAGKSPVVVLLFSRHIAPGRRAVESRGTPPRASARRPTRPDEIAVVVVDVADWSCRLPPNSLDRGPASWPIRSVPDREPGAGSREPDFGTVEPWNP